MSKKTLVVGLALSGSVLGLMWAAPARAQSALAQQEADQEKAAQQGTTTSSTKPDATTTPGTKPTATAKPPAAKPAAKSSDATTAKPAGTAKPAPAAKSDTVKAATSTPATKPTATTPKAATAASAPANKTPAPKPAAVKPVAKKAPAKPTVYLGNGVDDGTATATAGESKNGKAQNRDMAKAFEQSCPDVTLTEQKAKAGYDVSLEREPGSKGVKTVFGLTNVVHKTNKIEVTGKSGKEVFSESGHSTNQLVKDACAAMATPPTKVAKN